ncbi:MAG TPA: FeoB-associated Cys-rich membrane protein [Candidatus Enterenecus stercoripullorum]|nr:FeoB-associated Cys-rich membrane protein [Candidatus Enterenecus stercoripullorum]
MQTAIVVAVLAVIVALAIRSLIKQKKSGGGCSGDCGHCSGCH